MSRLLRATLRVHDDASWRLPDWEEYSDDCGSSSCSVVDGEGDGGAESEADDLARWRRRQQQQRLVINTTTAPSPRRIDLRALHERYAQQRQQQPQQQQQQQSVQEQQQPQQEETSAPQQAAIAAELASVRAQLSEFQSQWQNDKSNNSKSNHSNTSIGDGGVMASPAQPRAPAASQVPTTTTREWFDMATQTDDSASASPDGVATATATATAIGQWLHLIAQKVDVLAASFHHETTQLPIRYPPELLRTDKNPQSNDAAETTTTAGAASDTVESTTPPTSTTTTTTPITSWHVGGHLTELVDVPTAERLLELERAVACLATATEATTGRYVAYFEKIIAQIAELHQRRLTQIVDESLQEMKTQRGKYKRRLEQLEKALAQSKLELDEWRLKATAAEHLHALSKEHLGQQQLIASTSDESAQELKRLAAEIAQLRIGADEHRTDRERVISNLENQLQLAEEQLRAANARTRDAEDVSRRLQEQLSTIEGTVGQERAESARTITQLKTQLSLEQQNFADVCRDLTAKHETELADVRQSLREEVTRDVTDTVVPVRLAALQHAHAMALEELRQRWQETLEAERRRLAPPPPPMVVSQGVQTDLLGEDDPTMDPDERIARLKRRCRALEGLLDKKFETSSAASVASSSPRGTPPPASCSWTSRREASSLGIGTTLPLTDSLRSSFASSHGAQSTLSNVDRAAVDEEEEEEDQDDVAWASSRASGPLRSRSSSPKGPSNDEMLALVAKLERVTTQLPWEPETEPEVSASTTPRKKSIAISTRTQRHEHPKATTSLRSTAAPGRTPTIGTSPSRAARASASSNGRVRRRQPWT